MTIGLALVYLLVLVLVGFFTARRNRTAGDFFLAGRKLGFLSVSMATMASIMSGFVFVGGPGLFYQVGISSIWIIISSSFTGALMCWVLAKPLFRMAREQGCMTIPELVLSRFQCRYCSGLAAVAIILGVVGYLTAQLRALSLILADLLGTSEFMALLIGISVLIFYSAAGGMIASIYTDVVQGIIMFFTALLVFYFSIHRSGGMEAISRTILESEPAVLEPFGNIGIFTALSWFFVFALGSLGQPHVVHKFMMVRDLRILRFFPLVLAGSMLVCGLVWLGVGLSVKSLTLSRQVPTLREPDQAINVFLTQIAPPMLSAVLYVAILAAIMSTVDSFVNVGSAALTRDLPKAIGYHFRNQVLWARIWTFFLFVLAGFFAFRTSSLVAALGILSFGLFAVTLTPSLVLGLNWRMVTKRSARMSMVTGILFLGVGYLLQINELLASRYSPELIALVISFLTFLLVNEFDFQKKADSEGA